MVPGTDRRTGKGLLKASRAAGAPYVDRLAEQLPHLVEVESILAPMQPKQVCHLDLWADNLRRTSDGGLCVIDFDNCGPADPSRELAMVLVEFAELHHIGHRHLTMWLATKDPEARARSLAGIEEFLGQPLRMDDVDRLVAAVSTVSG